VYLVIKPTELEQLDEKRWREAAISLTAAVLGFGSGSNLQFETTQCELALWSRSLHYDAGKTLVFSFDSLQHSVFANADVTNDSVSPFLSGKCAFYAEEESLYDVMWSDAAWSPVVGGLVAAGV